jgi:hypothetical protein
LPKKLLHKEVSVFLHIAVFACLTYQSSKYCRILFGGVWYVVLYEYEVPDFVHVE